MQPNTDGHALIKDLPKDEEKEIDELILRIKNTYEAWPKIKSFALDEVLKTIKEDLESF